MQSMLGAFGTGSMRSVATPEQRIEVRRGRVIFQRRVRMAGATYLVRAVVDVDRDPPEVVTVYRTSRIGRYWRNEE